jgi:hypothetical protein
LVAHLTGGQGVVGSNPAVPTQHEALSISIFTEVNRALTFPATNPAKL